MMRSGSCTVAQLVAVLGLTGLGVGGYTYFSGSCTGCTDEAAATLVSTETESHGCCAAESKATLVADKIEGGCCSEEAQGGAVVTTVAAETESSCCTGEAKTACKDGTDGCTGDGKNGCCGGCAQEKAAEAEKVASSGAPAGGGK